DHGYGCHAGREVMLRSANRPAFGRRARRGLLTSSQCSRSRSDRTGSASDTLSGRHDTSKNNSYHVPDVLKSTDGGLPLSLTVTWPPICLDLPLLTSSSVTSARPLNWTLVGRRSFFVPLSIAWFHTVMPSTMIFGSSRPVMS